MERLRLGSIVPTIFGYDAVIIGEAEFSVCLEKCNIKRKTVINTGAVQSVYSRQDKLPINSEMVDLVYIAHSLEFSNNPHEILREAYRILRPDGHIVISMLNPFSIWGIWRNLAKWQHKMPWQGNFVSLIRLKDWLGLLGFDIMRVNHFGYCMPFNKKNFANISPIEKLGQRLELPFGAGYIVEASKRVIALSPIKPVWSSNSNIVSNDLTEPTT